jgi:hypothetical protein
MKHVYSLFKPSVFLLSSLILSGCGGSDSDSDGDGGSEVVTLDAVAPVITSGVTAVAIDENSGAGQVVYTVTSDDDTAIYSLSGDDSALFTIDSSTGEVTLTSNPDFGTQSSYRFTVTATDVAVNNSSVTVTFAINDIALESFNLGDIDASSGDIKQMALTWNSAADNANVSVTYTVCEKDSTKANNCNPLASVTDELTTNVTVDSLVSALSTDYFVLAHANDQFKASSEANLSTGEVTKMIGYLKASNTGADDEFGRAIALSGDGQTLAVAAPGEDNATAGVSADGLEAAGDVGASTNSGAVYLFSNKGGKWVQTAYVKASNTGDGDNFGGVISLGTSSLALNDDGSILAIGAYGEDNAATGVFTNSEELTDTGTATDSGAVYMFSNDGGSWQQTAYIKASNAGAGDSFGVSLALSSDGTTLAVGAFREANLATGVITDDSEVAGDAGTAPFTGAVYMFNNNGVDWLQTAYIKASNAGGDDVFGLALALSGDSSTLAVGAQREGNAATGVFTNGEELTDAGETDDSGAVYMFSNDSGDWLQTAYVKASNAGAGDLFGVSLALNDDGTALAVGAEKESNTATGVITDGSEVAGDVGTANSPGAVYLFTNNGANWVQSAYVKASKANGIALFGTSVAFNKEGDMLAVGAKTDKGEGLHGILIDGSETTVSIDGQVGAVYLFSNNDGWQQTAYVRPSNSPTGQFGERVALSDDGNTLAVGTSSDDNAATGVITDGSESPVTGTGNVGTADKSGAVYVY